MRGEGVLWLPRRIVVEHPLFRWERRLDRPWPERLASPPVHNVAAGLILTVLTVLWWFASPLYLQRMALVLCVAGPLVTLMMMRHHTARRFRQMRDQGLLRELACAPLPLSLAFAAMIRAHAGPSRVSLLLPVAVYVALEFTPWRLPVQWWLAVPAAAAIAALNWRPRGDCGVAISDVQWLILPPTPVELLFRHFTLLCFGVALMTVPLAGGLLAPSPFWLILVIGLIGGPILRRRERQIRGRAELESALVRYACAVGDDQSE